VNKLNNILVEILKPSKSWSDIHDGLKQYNTAQSKISKKKTIASKLFELFSKYYYQTNPNYLYEIKEVYLYEEIPQSILKKLRLPDIDHGVDLLLQDYEDNYYAVQCKFKNDEEVTLGWTKDKIANVFGMGINCDFIVIFTNTKDVAKPAKNLIDELIIIRNINLYELSDVDINRIHRMALSEIPPPLIKYKPLEHQIPAIQDVVTHFKRNKRCQLILPCGAGKTLTALWIKEAIHSKRTLVLLPSLALLKQIKNEWLRHNRQDYRYICVCSEKDIDKDNYDNYIINKYEIGSKVTTDAALIQKFLKGNKNTVIYSTYQSIQSIILAVKGTNLKFDLIVCDEAHKTSGSSLKNTFALIHNDHLIPSKKRLYMTATPKVVSTKVKSKLSDDEYELICDMSNPYIYGKEAHRLSFGKAIEQNILVDYEIIGIGVSDKDLQEYIQKRQWTGEFTLDEIAHNYALDFVMNKYKAFHSLSFHSTVSKAQKFNQRHQIYFPKTYSNSVNGKQSTNKRIKILNEFRESKKGVVSNARCLTEGVDVPTIDMIYFCDPKYSKIDIVQATGRALRKDKKGQKEKGYIVVPIFHHIDEDLENSITKKPIFKYLIDVVRSLADQDERLEAFINDLAYNKGEIKQGKIQIILPKEESTTIIRLEGLEDKVKNKLFDEIIEKTKNSWKYNFEKYKNYIAEYETMTVSRKEDLKLYYWVDRQRVRNRKGKLGNKKKEKLISIGFDFGQTYVDKGRDYDEIWWNSYVKLMNYKEKYGDTRVPMGFKDDPSFGTWVAMQRTKRRKGKLKKDREDLLNEIDFTWNLRGETFKKFYNKLVEFKRKNGHLNIVQNSSIDKDFARWINNYRIIRNNGTLQPNGSIKHRDKSLKREQIKKLDEIGFQWVAQHYDWYEYFEQLKSHYNSTGSSYVSSTENLKLYRWTYRMRKGIMELTKDQLKLLKSINFPFDKIQKRTKKKRKKKVKRVSSLKGKKVGVPKATKIRNDKIWMDRYNELANILYNGGWSEIKRENHPTIYNWVLRQRGLQKNNRLDEDKKRQLDKINFNWKPEIVAPAQSDDEGWMHTFNRLKEFKEKYGHTNVSQLDGEHRDVGMWLNQQRAHRKGRKSRGKILTLRDDREQLLTSIGVEWDRRESKWNERMRLLIEYRDAFGNYEIRQSDKKYGRLYYFIRKIRKDGLTKKQYLDLQQMGFDMKQIKIKE